MTGIATGTGPGTETGPGTGLPPKIGPYRPIRLLGEGGMGSVYEAVHETTSRRVAVKVLLPEYARDPIMTARFFNEARAVNKIEHPGILQIFDYGQQESGAAYIAMELLKGETLTARLTRGPQVRPLGEALRLGWQLASALSAAHAAGIVHRDLKPDNIMIIPDADAPGGERAKLLDFGIAKLIEGVRGDQPKTQSQVVMGTPQYMSPEQCKAARLVDEKTDVYALGTILFEMLAGRTPFVSDTAGEFIGMHLFKQPPRLGEVMPSVPREIAAFVDSTLGKEKEGRPTMGQMVETLSQLVRRYGAPGQASEQLLAVGSRTDSPTIRFSSTLGRAMGQLKQPGLGGSRRWLAVGAGALLGLGGLAVALRPGEPPKPVPMVAPAPLSRPEVKPAPRPEAKSVRWSLRSTPAGAAVVDGDGKVLGRTPWEPASPACQGTRSLVLRLAGYADQAVTLDCGQDADRQEQLRKAPSETKPRPAQKRATEKKIPDKIEYIE